MLVALAIGDQRAIPETQRAIFNKTGITHLVSISGVQVTVFAARAGAVALARRSVALTSRVGARKIAALVGAIVARDRHDVGDLDDALRRRRCIVVEARVGERRIDEVDVAKEPQRALPRDARRATLPMLPAFDEQRVARAVRIVDSRIVAQPLPGAMPSSTTMYSGVASTFASSTPFR